MTSHQKDFFRSTSIVLGLMVFLNISPVHALGLGDLSVLSALDEPLIAEVDLISVEEGALESLVVKLGTAEEFAEAGVPRETFLRTLEFSVVKGGTPRIRISTTFPAKEPFLHFLIRATWDDGNLLREYTALLDPPLYAQKQPTAVNSPGLVEQARQLATTDAVEEVADTGAEMASESFDMAAGEQSSFDMFQGAEYGPTGDGDTLWTIASGFDTQGRDVSVFQIMAALLRENPEAFIDNNINRLKKGQILRLSDPDAVDREEASLAYKAQLNDWEVFRAEAAQATDMVKVPVEQQSAEVEQQSAEVEQQSAEVESADASASGEGSAGESVSTAATDSDAGQSVSMEEAEAPAAEEDLLKIVRASLEEESEGSGTEAQGNTDADAEKELEMMQEKLSTLEESLVSSELQNQEFRERVVLLEEQVIKAQRLVELESQELALAQEQAARQQEERLLLEQQLAELQLNADGAAGETQSDATQPAPVSGISDTTASGAQESDKAAVMEPAAQIGDKEQTPAVETTASTEEATAPAVAAPVVAVADAGAEQQTEAKTGKTRIDPRKEETSSTMPVSGQPQPKAWWQNILDSVTGNFFSLIVGVGSTLALLGGAILFIRRRRSIAEFEESILSGSGLQGQTESTSTAVNKNDDTSFLSDFGMAGMGNMQADEVDPLAEAEVYLAYGRDEQAEEVLKEAAMRTPERYELKLKLLEIYKQRSDLNSFETLAEELYPAGGQGDAAIWSQVVQMGAKMNPDNPLFSQRASIDAPQSAPGQPELSAPGDSELSENLMGEAAGDTDPSQHPFPQPEDTGGIDQEFERLAEQMGLNEEASDQVAEAPDSNDRLNEDSDMLDYASNDRAELDFDIDLGGLDEQLNNSGEQELKPVDTDSVVSAEEAPAIGVQEIDELDLELPEMDFDIPEIPDEPVVETNTASAEADSFASPGGGDDQEDIAADDTLVRLDTADAGSEPGSGIVVDELWKATREEAPEEPTKDVTRNFGLVTDSGGIAGDAEDESDNWDEAATKLDLAQAYLNMGDKAGARSIIDEVMKEGSPAQKNQAAELQTQMG